MLLCRFGGKYGKYRKKVALITDGSQGIGLETVNVSSIGGVVGTACESVYTATKHGIIGLTKATALE
jgi:Dehydrogenases with different specificities (related to short-chain alcohol dehydrogenases)